MFKSQAEFREMVEDYALRLNESRLGGPLPLAFSLDMPEDVSSRATGEMFAADNDCIIVEVEIDSEDPNINQHSFKRAYGAVTCYFCTKGTQPNSLYWGTAEEVARWFSHRTTNDAHFRGLTLGQSVRHRGFRLFPIEVSFEFRLQPN